jgi:hypothetical protein
MNLAAHGEPISFGPRELNCPDVLPTHPNANGKFVAPPDARRSTLTSDVEGVTP